MIFGKMGRDNSEDIIIQLTRSKCVPRLMYGYLTKSQLKSLDFVISRLFNS